MEYLSFYCHTCYNFEPSVPIIKGNFPGKIEWKIIPIYWGEHGSPKPGEAYLIAEEMGKGEAMKKELFQAQMVQERNIGEVTVLEDIANKIRLGLEFGKKLRSGAKTKEVQRALDMAKMVEVKETPNNSYCIDRRCPYCGILLNRIEGAKDQSPRLKERI